jgi:hypothetical protein
MDLEVLLHTSLVYRAFKISDNTSLDALFNGIKIYYKFHRNGVLGQGGVRDRVFICFGLPVAFRW